MRDPIRGSRRPLAVIGVMAMIAFASQLALVVPAAAAPPFSGGMSPTIVGGGADVNGDGVVDATDDSNAFYGDTSIINGSLDCDAWTGDNGGEQGDGVIDTADDCTMIGYDGTVAGVTITVADGQFGVADGPLPQVFNAATPDNPDVGDSDFAWSTIGGLVDANGDETITLDDCHVDVIGSADILGNDGANTNPCGFATGPDPADNGKVDMNSDGAITSADSCSNECFLGLDVEEGLVVVSECAGYEGDPRNQVVGSGASETLSGTSGADVVCAKGGDDVVNAGGGQDLVLGGGGADVVTGAEGADTLQGGDGRDELRGGDGVDTIQGGDGNDALYGSNGNDNLKCGGGNDTAVGGPGKDTFSGCEHVTQ